MAERQVTVKITAQDAYSSTLADYGQKMGGAADATKKAGDVTNQLGDAIKGTFAGLGLQQVIAFGAEMVKTGDIVNQNRQMFAALTNDLGGQDTVMRRLRESTGGYVDDMTLMSNTNSLLRMGIVNTAGDAGNLIKEIIQLKSPTEDTTTAIQNFSLMLSNSSVARLDAFGLSASKARARIEELKAAGMDASEAFKQATFEQMSEQVDRLGDSADRANTPLARMETLITNIKNQAASNISTGFMATIDAATAYVDHSEDVARRIALLQQTGITPGGVDQGANAFFSAFGVGNLINSNNNFTQEQQDVSGVLLRGVDALVRGWNQATDALSDYRANQNALAKQQAEFQQNMASFRSQFGSDPNIFFDPSRFQTTLFQMEQTTHGAIDGQTLYTQADAQRAQLLADTTQNMVDNIKAIQPFIDSGLIPESAVDSMKAVADEAGKFNDNVQKGAALMKDMSFSKMLGITNGGAMGEAGGQFLDYLRQNGASDDQIAAYQQQIQLQSGQANSLSMGLPDFYKQLQGLNPTDAATAIQRLTTVLPMLAEAGMKASDVLGGNIDYLTGVARNGGGKQINVRPGDNLYSLAGRYGGNFNDYRSLLDKNGLLQQGTQMLGGASLMGNYDPNAIVSGMLGIGSAGAGFGQGGMDFASTLTQGKDDMSSMLSSSQGMGDQFGRITEQLDKISNMQFNWKVNVTGLPDWLQSIFAAGGVDFGAQMAKATVNNGGNPPGSTAGKPHGGSVAGNPYM